MLNVNINTQNVVIFVAITQKPTKKFIKLKILRQNEHLLLFILNDISYCNVILSCEN